MEENETEYDLNGVYRVFVMNTREESGQMMDMIRDALQLGFAPQEISWAPDGKTVIYTMVNTAAAGAWLRNISSSPTSALLQTIMGGSGGGPFGAS